MIGIMDNKETAKIFTPKIKTIILYLFLFIGIIIILREYIGGRSLWWSEPTPLDTLHTNITYLFLIKKQD